MKRTNTETYKHSELEIRKKQKLEPNESTQTIQQNKEKRNSSYINEIEDEKDFLNMVAVTENIGIGKELDTGNTNINRKRKRTQSRQQKFDEYISNLNHIPYDNNKTLFQNILLITDRAQEYIDTLRKIFHDYKTTKTQTTPTPFTTITTPTFSTNI